MRGHWKAFSVRPADGTTSAVTPSSAYLRAEEETITVRLVKPVFCSLCWQGLIYQIRHALFRTTLWKGKTIKPFERTFHSRLCSWMLSGCLMVERFAAKQKCQTCALKSSVPSLVVCPEVAAVVVIFIPGWRGDWIQLQPSSASSASLLSPSIKCHRSRLSSLHYLIVKMHFLCDSASVHAVKMQKSCLDTQSTQVTFSQLKSYVSSNIVMCFQSFPNNRCGFFFTLADIILE